MPGGNGTGPSGEGPLTGRGLGSCGSGVSNAAPNNNQGRGRGFGRGLGFGRGFGRGRRSG